MKKFLRILGAGAVAASLMLGVAACNEGGGTNTENGGKAAAGAYLSVMINPAVEMTVDEFGKVVTFGAGNDDAAVLLSGVDLTGMTVAEATRRITELAEKMGYLNEDHKTVKVIATADDPRVEADIEADAAAGAAQAADVGIEHSSRSLAREVEKLQQADAVLYKDLTAAKLRLIKTVMQFDETVTIETGTAMKVSELAALLEKHQIKYGAYVTKDLKKTYKALEAQKEYEIEKKIAAFYGVRYVELFERENRLDGLADIFEEELENTGMAEADLAQIVKLLGLADAEALKDGDGKITADSVEEYLDRAEDAFATEEEEEAFEETEDAIEEILDRYDSDEAALTESMRAKLAEAIGENTITDLEALEEYIDDIEDEMERIAEETVLTNEKKAEIEALEDEKDAIEDAIEAQLKDELQAVKDELQALKEQRLAEHENGKAQK